MHRRGERIDVERHSEITSFGIAGDDEGESQ
jgi:hypothetical protein